MNLPDLFGGNTEPEPVAPPPDLVPPEPIVPAAPEPEPVLPGQGALFAMDDLEWWRPYWQGMPEFTQEDLTPWKTYNIHFEGPGDFAHFAEVYQREFGQRPTLRAAWWPPAEIGRMMNKRFTDAS